MTVHTVLENSLLVVVVLCCWIGVLGMWRMRDPVQALHYLALPATFGAVALSVAVLLSVAWTQTFGKSLLIAFVLFWSNSITGHALARSFRARALGHWQPREGDPVEFVSAESETAR